jgi:PilZ domain-containing protein
MAEESEGSSYLAALKRGVGGYASAATAPTRSAGPRTPESAATANEGVTTAPARPEKRRSARYKCVGSAEIRKEGSDVRSWATCTDISVNGCYLETAATYPAATSLQLRIEANNFRIHVQGSVRVAYPQVGMGIGFTYMAEAERTHLKELLKTLSRPSVIMGSPLLVAGFSDPVPRISDPQAALSAIIQYFAERQLLTRSEFIMLLRRSQNPGNGSR